MSANTQVFGSSILEFGFIPVTITAAAGIVAHRFIKSDGSAYAAVEDSTCGVSTAKVTAAQVTNSQNSINAAISGICLVEASDVIAIYALVELEAGTATGRVVTQVAGTVRGKAMAASGAAGDIIPVLLAPTSK